MAVKFAHLRLKDKEGKIVSQGGATMAYMLHDNGYVKCYVFTHCHSKDNFSKKLGRLKAENMLKSKRAVTPTTLWSEKDLLDNFYSVDNVVA